MLSELDDIEIVGQAEAASDLKQLKAELVILDIGMRGGAGIGVLQNLNIGSPDSKVIVLTDYPYPQYRKICMSAGADFFFDKSTEFEKVIEVIKQLRSSSSQTINKDLQSSGG
jgi:DNA-binding NarL/FixJ family response regulator